MDVDEEGENENDNEEGKEDDYRLDETKEMFPCYKDDECFGGKKKLVKI